MLSLKSSLALGCAFFATGCAIHPLPKDVTRETTYKIVQKIRCEAREALDNITVQLLHSSKQAFTRQLGDRLAAGELEVQPLFAKYGKTLEPDLLKVFRAFTLSAVGFDFDFTITTDNNNMADANFRLPLTRGLFTLGLKAGKRLKRSNQRKFKVANSFYELHTELRREHCLQIAARRKHLIYPITGKIGLQEVFETFIRLSMTPGLASESFTDTLTFTTTVTASANPKIVLNAITDRVFRLANASATLAATRTDAHKVTISVERGDFITSLDQARRSAKKKVFRELDFRRSEDFFRRVDDLERIEGIR